MSRLSRTARSAIESVIGTRRTTALQDVAQTAVISGRWAASGDGRASLDHLRRSRNEFRGERAVIVGNGPSLRNTDLDLLKDECVFGLNRITLLTAETGFEPTFLVSVNALVLEQAGREIAESRARKFIAWRSRTHVPRDDRTTYIQSRKAPGFSRDPNRGLWEGATVTFVAMQLAYHMGFRRLVLVGVDHNFVDKGRPHEVVTSIGPDANHFHPEYFGKDFRWQLPDLETSELAYRMARAAFQEVGGVIVDSTVGGKLDVFPKLDLSAALPQQ